MKNNKSAFGAVLFKKLQIRIMEKFGFLLPDQLYLRLMYRVKMGYWPKLNKPTTFSEKLQWLKLYNRRPEYTTMVDKCAAKDYVAKIIGDEYIIPTLGVWDTTEDINWETLPKQFVLKCTHDSGGLVICRDKKLLDKKMAIKKLRDSLNRNYYLHGREWPYKNVPHRIIAEQYMEDKVSMLNDYKFSCFNGIVTDVMVCIDRQIGEPKFYFFDRQWNLLRLNARGKTAPKDFTLPKPSCMDKMFELASILSKGLPYARVDFYAVDGHPYFGEITFFPQSGFDNKLLPETDKYYGKMISLPRVKR